MGEALDKILLTFVPGADTAISTAAVLGANVQVEGVGNIAPSLRVRQDFHALGGSLHPNPVAVEIGLDHFGACLADAFLGSVFNEAIVLDKNPLDDMAEGGQVVVNDLCVGQQLQIFLERGGALQILFGLGGLVVTDEQFAFVEGPIVTGAVQINARNQRHSEFPFHMPAGHPLHDARRNGLGHQPADLVLLGQARHAVNLRRAAILHAAHGIGGAPVGRVKVNRITLLIAAVIVGFQPTLDDGVQHGSESLALGSHAGHLGDFSEPPRPGAVVELLCSRGAHDKRRGITRQPVVRSRPCRGYLQGSRPGGRCSALAHGRCDFKFSDGKEGEHG